MIKCFIFHLQSLVVISLKVGRNSRDRRYLEANISVSDITLVGYLVTSRLHRVILPSWC